MGLSNLKGRKMTVNSRCSNGTMVVALDEGIGSAELSDLGSMITIKGLDNPVYYFNRIKVEKRLQGKGKGKELMIEVCRLADKHGITIINELNPYGNRDMKDLKSFFRASGFKTFQLENTMVRKPRPV